MFARKAMTLVREIARTDDDQLGPYNADLVTLVIKEMHEHVDHILATLRKVQESGLEWTEARVEDATSVLVHHTSLLRNKRCLLAYIFHRMVKIKSLRWQLGAALPEHLGNQLNPSESEFFQDYSRLLGKYMGRIGLDLTVDLIPPKDPVIEVRVLEKKGDVFIEDKVLRFDKNLVHRMKREEAEPLILQGVLEHYTGL